MTSFISKTFAQGISILPNTTGLKEKIQSGDIHLSDIPDFISYLIQVGIIAAAMVSFLMLLVGGYQYIVGGLYSEMKEKGKTTLIRAVAGLVISMLAYAIVTIVQLFATAV